MYVVKSGAFADPQRRGRDLRRCRAPAGIVGEMALVRNAIRRARPQTVLRADRFASWRRFDEGPVFSSLVAEGAAPLPLRVMANPVPAVCGAMDRRYRPEPLVARETARTLTPSAPRFQSHSRDTGRPAALLSGVR